MTDLPTPSWAEFTRQFARNWNQGEHVFINGMTGSGKTELGLRVMNLQEDGQYLRKHAAFFVTKPRDPIFKSPLVKQFKRQTKFNPKPGVSRILLAPKDGDSMQQQVGSQMEVFSDALDRIYHDKGWCVGVDETLWFSGRLKLGDRIGDGAFMGRALGITYMFSMQRPAHVPVIIPQSCTHAFIGKTGRTSDLKTLAELYDNPKELEAAIRSLRTQHDFVYVDNQRRMPLQIVNTQR